MHNFLPSITFRLHRCFFLLFFFNDPATPEIYTLSLHDALPISRSRLGAFLSVKEYPDMTDYDMLDLFLNLPDRKSTRLNSSHQIISYAVFCLKKKKKKKNQSEESQEINDLDDQQHPQSYSVDKW